MSTLWFDEKSCALVMFRFPAIFAPQIIFSLNHNVTQIIVFQVTREVERRIEDLTHQVHREILTRSVDQVKTLAPILICSMKIFIQIVLQGSWYIFLLKRKRLPVWGHKDGTAKIILSLFKRIFILKLWSTSYSSSKPIKILCHNKVPLFFFNETIQDLSESDLDTLCVPLGYEAFCLVFNLYHITSLDMFKIDKNHIN